MANQIYDYLTPGDFTYDTDKIEVSGGITKLKETADYDGLVGYWKFEDDVLDSSAQGNDGTNYGATFIDAKVGRGLSFDGDDYVIIPHHSSLDYGLADFSIEFWINQPSSSTTVTFISKGLWTELGWVLNMNSGRINMTLHTINGGKQLTVLSNVSYDDSNWHHVVVTVDRSANNMNIYVDETEVVYYSGYHPFNYQSFSSSTDISNSTDINLGTGIPSADNFVGLSDEVAIYSRILELSEIQDHYSSGVGRHLNEYSIDKPTIEPTDLYDPTIVSSWDSFLETLGGGNQGSIAYNLYKVDKTNKYYWNGGAWVAGGDSDHYNSQAVINANIGSFDTSPDKIGFIAYLISDGEQKVELDENQITYTPTQLPLVNAGSDKTCKDNQSISPFSDCSFSDPDGTIDHVYYKVDGEVDTWSEIPQGGYGTLLEAVQAWTYLFANLGVKTVRLQVKDNNDATAEDSLTVTVSQYTVTFNVKNAIGNHVSNFYFVSEDGATPQLKSSPFTYDYDYKATPYNTVFYKDDYVTSAVDVDSTDHTENVTLTEPIYEETSRIYHPIRIELLNFRKSIIKTLIKGDTILFEVKVDADITDWKIRAHIWDDVSGGVDIKKATSNSGGSDFQIEVTDATGGVFIVKINKGETTDIENQGNLEIELETNEAKIYTVYQSILKFTSEKIAWDTP